MTDTVDAPALPTPADVAKAHERIAPHLHRTPVLTSAFIDGLTGASLFFKCENLQKTGAFKARGASNAVFGLDEEQARAGVATHSSGNHGAALAYAAGRRGIACRVVMPSTASEAKKAAVRSYGGEIVECVPSTSAREAALAELVERTGAEVVHPYNDARVIAGQATCARELIDEVPDLEAVIAPIGGGGLISGTCLALTGAASQVTVFGAEPEQADDALRSLRAGHLVADDAPRTIADGLRAPLKSLTWHFVSRHVADILTASEAEIVAAMRLVWTRMKIVIEPSSAVALAAILNTRETFAGKRVGVIVTGGNVDLDRLPWV